MATEINPIPPAGQRTKGIITAELTQVWPAFHHEVTRHIGGGGNGWVAAIRLRHGQDAVLKYYADSLESESSEAALSAQQRRELIRIAINT